MNSATAHHWSIGVVIPARNEEATIEDCIGSVLVAGDYHRRRGALWIVVVADSCSDRTASLALRAIGDCGQVIETRVRSAGAARRLGAAAVIERFRHVDPGSLWLANTDADTCVCPDWIDVHLRFADQGMTGVAGIVRLAPSAPTAPTRMCMAPTSRCEATRISMSVAGPTGRCPRTIACGVACAGEAGRCPQRRAAWSSPALACRDAPAADLPTLCRPGLTLAVPQRERCAATRSAHRPGEQDGLGPAAAARTRSYSSATSGSARDRTPRSVACAHRRRAC